MTLVLAVTLGLLATPAAVTRAGEDGDEPDGPLGFPVTINAGTCRQPGDVLFELGMAEPSPGDDVIPGEQEAVPEDIAEAEGVPKIPEAASPWRMQAEIGASFGEFLGEPRIVLVQHGRAAPEVVLACGQIGGAEDGDDSMVIGLRPLNGSALFGMAIFERDTAGLNVFGDDASGVTVYLFPSLPTLRGQLLGPASPTPITDG
jgi:hypothetical protein